MINVDDHAKIKTFLALITYVHAEGGFVWLVDLILGREHLGPHPAPAPDSTTVA